jgi:outer membrane protein OmpA-like peptidoglycan-associated protein
MYDDEQSTQQDPWSSIVDLMSALVLVLFLAVIFFITNYSEVTQKLDEEHQNLLVQTTKLEKSEAKFKDLNQAYLALEKKEQALTKQRDQLQLDKQLLQGQRTQLEADKQKLETDKIALNTDVTNLQKNVKALQTQELALRDESQALKKQTNRLKADKNKLRADKDNLLNDTSQLNLDKRRLQREKSSLNDERLSLLKDKTQLLSDQKSLLGDKEKLQSDSERLNAIIIELKGKMKALLESQNRIMTSLDQAFKNAQGVKVDKEGGKIIMKSEVLFTRSEAKLSPKGEESLKQVAKALHKVFKDKEFNKSVEGIMIEGHTSSDGNPNDNFNLSSKRSLNALKYLLSIPFIKRNNQLSKSLFAAAFGESRPVLKVNKNEDKIKSRRIEIRMIFNQNNVKKLTHELTKFK